MIVNNCNDCTVYQYMQCKFKHNLKVLIIEGEHTDKELQQAFSNICIEYLDAAGIEIEHVADREEIVKLDARCTYMQTSIKMQRLALRELGEPFTEALEDFGKYSYSLQWTGDVEKFRKDLDRIEKQEKTFVVQLEDAVNAYKKKEDMKNAANIGQVREVKTEADFVRMLNELSKFQGFHLKPKEISMLELAGLIRTLNEANQQANSN
jgi:hypothetical protein